MTPTTITDLQTAFTTALAGADPLLRLRAAHALETALAALRWPLVEVALDAGHTWAEIAAALDDTELGLILDHLHHQHTTLGRKPAMTDHHPTVAELTETAAEAIRAANHRTISPGDLTVPDVNRVLGELAALSRRLPQLYEQLARNLRHRQANGDLRLDDNRSRNDASEAIAEADTALRLAASLTPEITRLLDQAQNDIAFVADCGADA